jgi:hypothetical protein
MEAVSSSETLVPIFQTIWCRKAEYHSLNPTHVDFVVNIVAMGRFLAKYFVFPCQFSFHQFLHTHLSLPSGAGTIGPNRARFTVVGALGNSNFGGPSH